jgi:hypothetical protein
MPILPLPIKTIPMPHCSPPKNGGFTPTRSYIEPPPTPVFPTRLATCKNCGACAWNSAGQCEYCGGHS